MFSTSSSVDSEAAAIFRVVATARRRSLAVDALKYLAWAACGALTLMAAALMVGFDILPAWLLGGLVILLGVGWAVAVYRRRKAEFAVARILDEELSLKDTLSTAYFVLNEPEQQKNAWSRWPVVQAAKLTQDIQPDAAFPWQGQRWWMAAGALAVTVGGLFVARYAVLQSLSLRPPLVRLTMPPLLARLAHGSNPKELSPLQADKGDRNKAASNTQNKKDAKEQPAAAELPKPLPSVNQGSEQGRAGNAKEQGKLKSGAPEASPQGTTKTTEDAADQSKNENGAANNSNPNGQNSASETAQQSQKNENAAANSNSNSQPGLMSRMKDALSNMMAKVSPRTGGQKSPNAGDPSGKSAQKGQEPSQGGEQQAGQQGQGEKAKGDSQDNASGKGDGQTAEKAGNAQGRSGGDSPQKGNEAQSGVGKQEGDKGIRDAEQQKAMGKLAEIIGKRSADLTGEMTMETPSGNQQLKTEYSQRQGKHSDSGGEINSNEVPLRYQQYVKQYMEAVHKSPPPK